MKLIDEHAFDVITDENIRDFVKYYGTLFANKDGLIELELDYCDLPYSKQLALIRFEDEEYEYTILENHFEDLDKSSLVLLLNSQTHDDLLESKSTLISDINFVAVDQYKEACQDLINYYCVKISEEEQKKLDKGLKYS